MAFASLAIGTLHFHIRRRDANLDARKTDNWKNKASNASTLWDVRAVVCLFFMPTMSFSQRVEGCLQQVAYDSEHLRNPKKED